MTKIFLQTVPVGYSMTVAELPPAALEAIKRADLAAEERRRSAVLSVAAARMTKLKSAKASRRLRQALKLFGGR
jgi:hypothetical protein